MASETGTESDFKPEVRFGNALSIFYVVLSIVWTMILVGGMAFLWIRREMPILRIRGLPLSFVAITFLHLYWLAVQIAYIYGPLFPEVAEYWIMGIWLPFGVALFHASNSRFLYVAAAQKKFVNRESNVSLRSPPRGDLIARWRRLNYAHKTMYFIGVGMALHFVITLVMFLVSRKFHPSFGVAGTEFEGDYFAHKAAQGRGWEWWPSVFWQMFWAWVIAPVILWQARGLRDTQGWRLQTIACCISNLHAAPMWLVALYVPAMGKVNNVWIPPQWIAISIMLLEIFTVFIPVVEVCRHRTLTQETLDSIARWESRQKTFAGGNKSLNSESTASTWTMGRMNRASSIHTSSGGSILTMDALEHTLSKNPEPLQEFSALKDFSGENIAFLTKVKEWRSTWFPVTKESEKDSFTKEVPRECFESALRIYIEFISASQAEFQINLSSPDFKSLQAIFETAARIICGDELATLDPATPFNDDPHRSDSDSTTEMVRYWGDIPATFGEHVFDDAEMSIKYLVLTNTWPKFIKARRSFDSSSASLEAGR